MSEERQHHQKEKAYHVGKTERRSRERERDTFRKYAISPDYQTSSNDSPVREASIQQFFAFFNVERHELIIEMTINPTK
jgi:hypothetical protein